MARMFAAKLNDPFTQVGVSDFDTESFQVGIEPAFFGQHRFTFHHTRDTVPLEDSADDRVVLGGVASPMDLCAEASGLGLELFEIYIAA
jgi:hypothetical protein